MLRRTRPFHGEADTIGRPLRNSSKSLKSVEQKLSFPACRTEGAVEPDGIAPAWSQAVIPRVGGDALSDLGMAPAATLQATGGALTESLFPFSATLPSAPSRLCAPTHVCADASCGCEQHGGIFGRRKGEGAVRRRLGSGGREQHARAAAVCAGRSGGLVEVMPWARGPS